MAQISTRAMKRMMPIDPATALSSLKVTLRR